MVIMNHILIFFRQASTFTPVLLLVHAQSDPSRACSLGVVSAFAALQDLPRSMLGS